MATKLREEPIPALSAGLSHAMMTGLVLLGTLPVLDAKYRGTSIAAPVVRLLETPRTPPPAASPAPSSNVAEATPVKDEWAQDEIARAREQCMHVLSTTAAEVEFLEPIKKGECGLPAPVRLKSLGGSDQKVVFDPPVDINCRMVAALGTWAKTTLQPKARSRFKSPVTRIIGASGYSCRNIYNRPNARLSQHALANAIDIGGFTLASGRTVYIVKSWGPTARDIAAQAKAAAEAASKGKKARSKKELAQGKAADVTDADPAPSGKSVGRAAQASMSASSKKLVSLQTKAVTAAIPAKSAKPTAESLFLRDIHGGACRSFGTVMGPEANDPHRNHFHLDLITRRSRGYCQ